MSRKIWRYTVQPREHELWNADNMMGWRKAFQACVEDDAREQGSNKYIIYDLNGEVLAKDIVKPLPKPKHDYVLE